MEKSDGICSPAFVVDDFLELCLHVSILLRKDFRSTEIIALPDFQYWLNSNVLGC